MTDDDRLYKKARCAYCGETFEGEYDSESDEWSTEPRIERNEHIKVEHLGREFIADRADGGHDGGEGFSLTAQG